VALAPALPTLSTVPTPADARSDDQIERLLARPPVQLSNVSGGLIAASSDPLGRVKAESVAPPMDQVAPAVALNVAAPTLQPTPSIAFLTAAASLRPLVADTEEMRAALEGYGSLVAGPNGDRAGLAPGAPDAEVWSVCV
jgi:hypothetical protein